MKNGSSLSNREITKRLSTSEDGVRKTNKILLRLVASNIILGPEGPKNHQMQNQPNVLSFKRQSQFL